MPAERRGAITGAFVSASSTATTTNTMFGTPAPAAGAPPAFGAPAFGGAAPAPGGFGSTPAPAPGGFGSAPAPAPGGFGTAPAPAPGGFGTTPAPAPGGFGTTPAPALGGFGTTPAPALGGFGATNPAPAPGGFFGSATAPAPAPLFGASAPAPGGSFFGAPAPGGSLFGAPAPASGSSLFATPAPGASPFGAPTAFGQPATAQAAGPPPALAGHMPYAALPPDQKRAIDSLYQVMMQHKRTTLQVSAMAPKLLEAPKESPPSLLGTATEQDQPLAPQMQKLSSQADSLHQELQTLRQSVEYTRSLYETSTTQAIMFAQWPTEAIATRRGVALSKGKNTMDSETQVKLRQLLDRQMVHVDRIERMPSPYLWQTLDDQERRLEHLKVQMESLYKNLQSAKQIPTDGTNILTIIQMQEQAIWKIASAMASVHKQVELVRQEYNKQENGTNVLLAADQIERERQAQLEYKMREQRVKSLPAAAARPGVAAPGGSTFGAAPSGGLFGTPSSGGLFGSSPAPAPAPGGFFGSTPAPAPGGGLFGSAPAPAPGSLLGSTSVPAPAFGAPAFGAPAPAFGAPAPAPSGNLFGKTPAPAFGAAPTPAFGAAPTPAFGATPAPAPAGGGAFGSTPAPVPAPGAFGSTSSSTPKSKNKSRGTRRR